MWKIVKLGSSNKNISRLTNAHVTMLSWSYQLLAHPDLHQVVDDSTAPSFHDEHLDSRALVIAGVACDEGQIVLEGCRTNDEVRLRKRVPGFAAFLDQ